MYLSNNNSTNQFNFTFRNKQPFLFLVAIFCLLSSYSCQKETIAPLPESTTITAENTDESQYFKINTLEDLAIFEKLFVQNEGATSRSNLHGKIVQVPNNSKNAIQAAIAEAGRFGLVVLAKGNHYEDEPIVIDHPVYILGRKGATVISGSGIPESLLVIIKPIFSIRNTTRVTIWGVAMQGKEGGSSTAVEILNATHTVLAKSTINNFDAATFIEGGDHTLFWKNEIIAGVGFGIAGIGLTNGVDVRIIQNKVAGFFWNMLSGGQDGIIQGNEFFGSPNIGLNLDRIDPVVQTSEGNIIGSTISATNWTVRDNYAHHNGLAGYAVSSGANNNTLIDNRGGNNGGLDLILAGDGVNVSGNPSATSFDNFVDARDNTNFTMQDCGNNNRVVGGVQIPCN